MTNLLAPNVTSPHEHQHKQRDDQSPNNPPSWEWGSECESEDVALMQTEGEPGESHESATTFVDAWLQTD